MYDHLNKFIFIDDYNIIFFPVIKITKILLK